MILEAATLSIKAGQEEQFESVFPAAEKVLARARGYRSHQLHRCIENPSRYLLLVQWETLEDHTVGFRGSADFSAWRGHIGKYFEALPVVEHFNQRF